VLQSQLFLLKLLSACLQHHWTQYRKQQKELQTEQQQQPFLDSNQAIDTSSNISTSTTQRTKTSDELDPPALDETLVNFLLSLLSKFLCQMHVIEERNEQLANLSTEYPNEAMAYASKADPQTLDVIKEVYSTAGKILHYLSASNWSAYYSKIKNAVNILSAVSESSDLNPPEIRILSFASLNVAKLHIILTGNCFIFILGIWRQLILFIYLFSKLTLYIYRIESILFKYENTRKAIVCKDDSNCYLEMD
jgi:neurofibromin 1